MATIQHSSLDRNGDAAADAGSGGKVKKFVRHAKSQMKLLKATKKAAGIGSTTTAAKRTMDNKTWERSKPGCPLLNGPMFLWINKYLSSFIRNTKNSRAVYYDEIGNLSLLNILSNEHTAIEQQIRWNSLRN